MSEPLLEVRDLTVDFRLPRSGLGRRPTLRAVDHVSFSVAPGETLGLVGESGSGKTTIGRCLLGLQGPTGGSIRFDGVELVGGRRSERRRRGAQLQVVFQNPYASLNPALTVGQALAEPLRVHRRLSGAELDAEVAGLLGRVGLDPSAASRRPNAFSGGQRQRIAIARAIALDPRFVVYDEAVSALDVSTRGQIINLLDRLRRELGIGSLFIGHDLAVVRHVSERIAVLYRGHLVELGTAVDVADRPAHPYTQRLVESVLVADPVEQRARRLRPRPAVDPSPPPPGGCPYRGRCPHRVERCDVEIPALRPVAGRFVACHLAETVVTVNPAISAPASS